MIQRKKALRNIRQLLNSFPAVGILGPRQCGKTTLAHQIKFDHFFDLENPRDFERLRQPQLALEHLTGTIVIDEVQRKPDLFPLLRYLIDRNNKQKFLLLSSASRDLVRQGSESLAGRIGYFHLQGFTLEEIGNRDLNILWLRGGFPGSFLARTNTQSLSWQKNYITTFLEKDIPQLGIQIPAGTLRRFWIMLSHYHGQVLNYSELGRSFGISDVTVKKYLDILEGTFMVRLLHPWHMNTKKRLVKSPKLYFCDSGIFHTLQTIETNNQLLSHPKLGASWEGFALEMVSQILTPEKKSQFFWRTHGGAELDLFWQQKGKSWGVEFKYSDAPRFTKSMQEAVKDLKLSHLWVIYPGPESYLIDKKVTVIPLKQAAKYLTKTLNP
jgi:uncharacterized protein